MCAGWSGGRGVDWGGGGYVLRGFCYGSASLLGVQRSNNRKQEVRSSYYLAPGGNSMVKKRRRKKGTCFQTFSALWRVFLVVVFFAAILTLQAQD